jgi:OOP family OmpA-OmpF porin
MAGIFRILLLLILSTNLLSAKIRWAAELEGYSSQAAKKQYSAYQILGEPSVMPDFGLSQAAWTPDREMRRVGWIRVSFEEKIYPKKIFIHENFNPGAIIKVFIYDSLDRGYQVYSNNFITPQSRAGRMLVIDVPETGFRTDEMKIEINTHEYFDYYQIDAVGISDTDEDYEIQINLPEQTEEISEPENLGKNVNSEFPELAPLISPDGNYLFFTRDLHPENIGENNLQDVWFSKRMPDGSFSKAENIGSPINDDKNNFAISVVTDGSALYLGNKYNKDSANTAGFSISNKTDSGWTFPDSISIEAYYNYSKEGTYNFSSNRKILLMSIRREDTRGGSDIYVSFLGDDGTWSAPFNLGDDINTAADDISPFLASDGKSLYFSTSGYPGYGSNDMFVSRRLDDTWTKWSEPENLGPSINTKQWDAYYTISAKGDYAYFVSRENSIGAEDIFRVKLPVEVQPETVVLVKGRVLDANTGEPIKSTIRYEILPGGQEAGIAESNLPEGAYSIVLPAGEKYAFFAETEGYYSITEFIDLKDAAEYREIERDIAMKPVKKDEIIRLNNIFFDFGEYELLEDSFSELKRLIRLMNQNPEMKIRINGHTDNIGSRRSNLELSRQRANAVMDYLTGNGISGERIKTKGFGFDKPVADNSTEEGRGKNRRVEFEIVEN